MTDYVANPSNAQARINALLPGDTLTLQPGTYPALTVPVSGTENNPILIRGSADVDAISRSPTIVGGSGASLTITGSYLHLALMTVRSGSRGVDINGAYNVTLESFDAEQISGEGYCVRNNSRYIYLIDCSAGHTSLTPNMSVGFRIGTPSSSWSGGVPDDTSFVRLRFCRTVWITGTGFRLHEGAHHIVVEDCDDDHSGDNPAGSARDSYDSQASYVQFKRCFATTPPRYGWRCFETTVNGVRYGGNQEVYMCAARDPGLQSNGGGVASQALDLRVYGFRVNTLFAGQAYVEVSGVPWTTTGVLPRSAFTQPLTWASPAASYALYPEGPNEYGLFRHHWGAPPFAANADPLPQGRTIATEFWVDEPVRVTKIGYWQGVPGIVPTKGAIFDVATRQMLPGSLVELDSPAPTWGWCHTSLDQTVVLEPHRRYFVAVFSPAGTISALNGGLSGIVMGLFPPQYWDGGYGMDGVTNGLIHAPNRSEASISDTTTLAAGDDIRFPDFTGVITIGSNNGLIDVIVGHNRAPQEFIALPGDNLQQMADNLIPGDVLTISGEHTVDLSIRVNGTADRPITIRGDGTAVLKGPWGTDGVITTLRVAGNYLHIKDLTIEDSGRAVVVEGCHDVKLSQVDVKRTRGAGFTVQQGARYIYHVNCTVSDTGVDLNTGDGFRCGSTPSEWPGGSETPDQVRFVSYTGCTATRVLGDGFDINSGASDVVLKNCVVDHTQGNIPAPNQVSGTSGFHGKADRVQFINCQVTGAPGDGYRCFDVLWSKVVYGRNQEVKAGFSVGHGEAGVASQSEGMKVYSDFTADPPRIKEVAGGWAATGSNVNPTSFVERTWTSPAESYS